MNCWFVLNLLLEQSTCGNKPKQTAIHWLKFEFNAGIQTEAANCGIQLAKSNLVLSLIFGWSFSALAALLLSLISRYQFDSAACSWFAA